MAKDRKETGESKDPVEEIRDNLGGAKNDLADADGEQDALLDDMDPGTSSGGVSQTSTSTSDDNKNPSVAQDPLNDDTATQSNTSSSQDVNTTNLSRASDDPQKIPLLGDVPLNVPLNQSEDSNN